MKTQIKTLDIHAKEWFDRSAGNSYFSACININYGMKSQVNVLIPFQYGYGDHYKDMALKELIKQGFIKDSEQYQNGGSEAIWKYCERKNIILRTNKVNNCKKSEVIAYGIS